MIDRQENLPELTIILLITNGPNLLTFKDPSSGLCHLPTVSLSAPIIIQQLQQKYSISAEIPLNPSSPKAFLHLQLADNPHPQNLPSQTHHWITVDQLIQLNLPSAETATIRHLLTPTPPVSP